VRSTHGSDLADLCHSTVDNAIAPGIGRRFNGWANRTLNVGAIIALSPAVSDKRPFQSWGPGKFVNSATV